MLAASLIGCAGGGGSASAPDARPPASTGRALLTIPAPAPAAARRAQFISPSASSVVIGVRGEPPTTSDISATSPLCTTGSGGRTCTVPLTAPIGSDIFSFTLYDGANGTGNVLGSGSASVNVVAGAPFTVQAAIGGTVAKVSIQTVPADAALTSGTPATLTLAVIAQDTDGNAIIGGAPYAAPITLTDSDTSGAAVLSTTTVTAPGATVTLTYNGAVPSGGVITIGATVPNVSAANISPLTLPVGGAGPCAPPATNEHRLYVANDGGGNDLQFTPPYTGAPATLAAVGNPVWLNFDHSGNLFVAAFGSSGYTSSGGGIVEWAPPYTGAALATIGNGILAGPRGDVLDNTGQLFVTDQSNNRVVQFVPPYTAAPTTLFSISSPYGITLDAACDLFVTNGSATYEYVRPYTGAPITVAPGVTNPLGMTFDGSANLFVSDSSANRILEFAPPYTGAPLATITLANGSGPIGLAMDASFDLFVDEYSVSTIVEYAPPYTGAPILTISSGSMFLPADISFGP